MIDSTSNENWGSTARYGLFIVGNEAVPEAEWWAMAPPNVSIHAARVTASAPWASWNASRTEVELAADVRRGAQQFSAMRLDRVVIGHSSSSFLGGIGWDEAIINALAAIVGPGIVAGTNGLDCVAAMRACDIRKPLLVLPPWFGAGIVEAAKRYFTDHGLAPAALLSYDPGGKWQSVPPQDMYPQGLGFEQELQPLYQQITTAPSTDGVLIAGTGFRCVGIIDKLESKLGLPVVTANQASLWRCLQSSGVNAPVSGYGQLLAAKR